MDQNKNPTSPFAQNEYKLFQRKLKNKENIEKYIKKLRNKNLLDEFFEVNGQMMTLLMYFVINNDLGNVQDLLGCKNPANTTIVDNDKQNALMFAVDYACKNDQYNLLIIDELLKHKPEEQLLQQDLSGQIALHEALENGKINLVKVLLTFSLTEQLEIKDLEETTAFVFAARSKNNQLILWLFQQYPEILSQKSLDGFTALHFACKSANQTLAWFIMQKSSENQALIPDKNGQLPLVQACTNQADNTDATDAIIHELMKKNPVEQLTHVDIFKYSIFHMIPSFDTTSKLDLLIKYCDENNIDIGAMFFSMNDLGLNPMQILFIGLQTDFPINIIRRSFNNNQEKLKAQDTLGNTLLMWAVQKNNVQAVKELATYACNEQFLLRNNQGETPLFCAVNNNYIEIVEILLSNGPQEQLDTQETDCDLLSYAVLFKKDIEVVKLIIKYIRVEQLLVSKSVGFVALNTSVAPDMIEYFNVLIEAPFIKNVVNLPEATTQTIPLHTAVQHNNLIAAQGLIKAGSYVNATNKQGWTPVHAACRFGNLPMFQLLMANGGNVFLKPNDQFTSMDLAIFHGSIAIVKELLVVHKFAPNSSISYKSVFFSIARGKNDLIDLLHAHGININLSFKVDHRYQSSLLIAIRLLNLPLVEKLKNLGARIDQLIHENGATISDFIKFKYLKKPIIYQEIRKIFPELPDRDSKREYSHIVTDTPQPHYESSLQDFKLKPRDYLLSIGYPEEQIKQMEAERKANKANLKLHTKMWVTEQKKPEELIYFLTGEITSAHESIKEIEGAGGENNFCYLDLKSLSEQGFDQTLLKNIRFKFDGQHIKKLDDDKGKNDDTIQLSPNCEPSVKKYTHELKVDQMARILLFQEGPLLIGIKYIHKGLHKKADMQSQKDSSKSNTILQVNWPDDIIFANVNNGFNKIPI